VPTQPTDLRAAMVAALERTEVEAWHRWRAARVAVQATPSDATTAVCLAAYLSWGAAYRNATHQEPPFDRHGVWVHGGPQPDWTPETTPRRSR